MDSAFDHKELKDLRRRMGWTSSDLARRLNVAPKEVEGWEKGQTPRDHDIITQIEFLFRQAEIYSDEVKQAPLNESRLDESSLVQISGEPSEPNSP